MKRIAWLGREDFDLVHAFEGRPVVLFPALFEKKRGARLIWTGATGLDKAGRLRAARAFGPVAVKAGIETHFEGPIGAARMAPR